MRRIGIALAISAILAAGGAAAAQTMLDREAVAQKITETLGARVLGIEQAQLAGNPVYIATVMHPGGNTTAAFEVSRIAIDARTGALLPPIILQSAGYLVPPAGRWFTDAGADGRITRQKSLGDQGR